MEQHSIKHFINRKRCSLWVQTITNYELFTNFRT